MRACEPHTQKSADQNIKKGLTEGEMGTSHTHINGLQAGKSRNCYTVLTVRDNGGGKDT